MTDDDVRADARRDDRFCLRCLVCGACAALLYGRHQVCADHAETLLGAARAGYSDAIVDLDDEALGLARVR